MSRFLELDGCFNFRDLGGHRTVDGRAVATGVLFRSDGLHRLSETGRVAFAELGVVTVLDLRTQREVEHKAWRPPQGWSGRWRHVPLVAETPDWSTVARDALDDPGYAATHYAEIAAEGAANLRASVEALVEPEGLPAVFHCAAGKDRTGILAALILRLLGVPVEDVADDYALSEEASARWAASVAASGHDDTAATWPYIPPSMLRSERGTMVAFLSGLGPIEEYARSLGITDDTVARLRSALLR
ncbi:tyrosine-protein phosphatase [Actinokineospora diospyrosa]|uniref:Protein tyrosine/serine phosphatase n=1 Tax=Actinokineospora diospyrosa TaxID=103728 RepID=A0ABT1I626_9PSEU|nr:tyrosine-protein phosphatase [Actinokineospora diospyrosa]MCP2268080.1 Protein tyrosine/serine phosphatase [Actinokineospora diospyrosa]